MNPLKATLIDGYTFKLLAIPFGGPIPSKHTPLGVDLDGEWFDQWTDIKPGWLDARVVDWHHGKDPTGVMGKAVLGKAVDLEMRRDGWWVTVRLNPSDHRVELVRRIGQKATIYGSSESLGGHVQKDRHTGHIDVWPYWKQTLSTSPQNTLSVIR